jgi:hypothetical protein
VFSRNGRTSASSTPMVFIQKDMNAALRNSARGDANRFRAFVGFFAMMPDAMT